MYLQSPPDTADTVPSSRTKKWRAICDAIYAEPGLWYEVGPTSKRMVETLHGAETRPTVKGYDIEWRWDPETTILYGRKRSE